MLPPIFRRIARSQEASFAGVWVPISPSRSATDKLGGSSEGRELAHPVGKKGGAFWAQALRGTLADEGPFAFGRCPSVRALLGMPLRRSTEIYPKELTHDVRGLFNSLLKGPRLTEDQALATGERDFCPVLQHKDVAHQIDNARMLDVFEIDDAVAPGAKEL